MTQWTPRELTQFVGACWHCGKRIRRTGMPGGWQDINGLFICYTGELPNRSDLDRRHEPFLTDEERAEL
jgi:hypothetical protein